MAIGRICCDAEGKLNEASVMLETSRHVNEGGRVKLLLHDVCDFSLFPGMICAVEGVNGGGGYFAVSKVLPVSLSSFRTLCI